MSWTPERVSKLKELWGKGNTASQIAEIIGDVTRNAVIGKAHRLNLATKSAFQKVKKSKEERKSLASGDKKVSIKSRFKSILLDKNFEPEHPKTLEELTIFVEDPLSKDIAIVACMSYIHFKFVVIIRKTV